MSSPPDEQPLIQRAQAGSADAFAQLLAEHYGQIFRFAYRWSGNRSDAEDITQEACLKLARALGQFRFESAFSSWLYRLVINTAKDWYKRQHKLREAQPLDEMKTGETETDEIETNALCQDASHIPIYLRQVLQHLGTLADGFKETALLVHAEGLSHAEAAVILGIKEATVSWRLHEIRKHLQRLQHHEGPLL